MNRTALIIPALAGLALLGGCATDGAYYSGGSGYYGGAYYDGYYGPDYYPGVYGYAYIPRAGGGYRGHGDHDRWRDHNRGDGRAYNGGQTNGGQPNGNWTGGNRGNWNGGASQAMRDADRAAHPQSFNADGERITRGNFWRQNQGSMNAQPQQAAPSPPAGDGGGRGFRGRRGSD
jgi:hypothetical protein